MEKNKDTIDIDAIFGHAARSFTETRRVLDDNVNDCFASNGKFNKSNAGFGNTNYQQQQQQSTAYYQTPQYGYDEPYIRYNNGGYMASGNYDAYGSNVYGYSGYANGGFSMPNQQYYGYPQQPSGQPQFQNYQQCYGRQFSTGGYFNSTYGKMGVNPYDPYYGGNKGGGYNR